MRDGLQALLRTIPEIEIVGLADCESEALVLIAQQQPAIVLLDSSLTHRETLPTLMQIKGGYPRTRCIVLVENVQQQGAAREAGADTALITGFSAEVLHSAIDQILMSFSISTESEERFRMFNPDTDVWAMRCARLRARALNWSSGRQRRSQSQGTICGR